MIKYSGLFLLFLAFFSCNNDDMTFQIGSKYLDVKTNIRYVDSLTVLNYTVKMDSIRTSGMEEPTILVGKHHDPDFGDITARSYFRVNPPSAVSLPNNAIFDSLQLILLYSDYAIGDTNVTYTIHAHRLQKSLKPRADGYFYNTSETDFYPEVLGTTSLIPWPNTNDTLWIRLDDELGNDLFDLLMEDDQIIKESELFHNYFKGFALTYDDADNAVLGFNFPTYAQTSSGVDYYPVMRLYYHYFDFTNVSKYADFKIAYENVGLQYNQLTLSNPVVNFPTQQRQKLPAQESNNQTYIQAGTGIVTRIEVPYLKNLLALHDNILIMKAELQLEPVRGSYFVYPLPEQVSVYSSDRINRFGTSFAADGILSIDNIYQEETWYTYDVTNFIKAKIIEETDDVPALLVTVKPENMYKTFDRVVLGSQLHGDNQIKLKIYYINYE
jgi:hypothetical protein